MEGLSKKGDVIEAVLANCRETGPAIDKALVAQRLSFNALMVSYSRALDHLFRRTFDSGCGRPLLRQCPDTDLLVKTVLFARRVVNSSPSTHDQDEANFNACVGATLKSVGLLQN